MRRCRLHSVGGRYRGPHTRGQSLVPWLWRLTCFCNRKPHCVESPRQETRPPRCSTDYPRMLPTPGFADLTVSHVFSICPQTSRAQGPSWPTTSHLQGNTDAALDGAGSQNPQHCRRLWGAERPQGRRRSHVSEQRERGSGQIERRDGGEGKGRKPRGRYSRSACLQRRWPGPRAQEARASPGTWRRQPQRKQVVSIRYLRKTQGWQRDAADRAVLEGGGILGSEMNVFNVSNSTDVRFPCSHSANGCGARRDLYDRLPELQKNESEQVILHLPWKTERPTLPHRFRGQSPSKVLGSVTRESCLRRCHPLPDSECRRRSPLPETEEQTF